MLESGRKRFATASTGNAGTSYAYALQTEPFALMEMHMFVGAASYDRSHHCDAPNVHIFALRDGSFVQAGAVAGAYAAQVGMLADELGVEVDPVVRIDTSFANLIDLGFGEDVHRGPMIARGRGQIQQPLAG
jgi:hypothetical protein